LSGTAYIIPAYQVFHNIRDRLGELEILDSNTSLAGVSTSLFGMEESETLPTISHNSIQGAISHFPPRDDTAHEFNSVYKSLGPIQCIESGTVKPPIRGVELLGPDGVELTEEVTYPCCFWFLHCSYATSDEAEWKVHCKSHLHGRTPPKTGACSFCPATFASSDGEVSWKMKIEHLAAHHRDQVDLLIDRRPDYDLFGYLWHQKIISKPDFQELMSNHRLSRPFRYFLQHGGRVRDDRLRGSPIPQLRVTAFPSGTHVTEETRVGGECTDSVAKK
jgi:hypothetical protein